MSLRDTHVLHIYKAGRLTVVGFEGRELVDPQGAEEIKRALLDLVGSAECQILAVDLMDVGIVSSWILGILAAVRQRGTRVELYHPSEEIREVLNTTQLNRLLHVRGTCAGHDDSAGTCAVPSEIPSGTT